MVNLDITFGRLVCKKLTETVRYLRWFILVQQTINKLTRVDGSYLLNAVLNPPYESVGNVAF